MKEKFKNVPNIVQNNVQIRILMVTASISEFRKDMKQYLDRVTEDLETLVIHRGKDDAIVVISLEEYNSLTATHHELSSLANQKRLDSSIEKIRSGNYFTKDLIEE